MSNQDTPSRKSSGKNISRQGFLKIAGAASLAALFPAACATKPTPTVAPTAIPPTPIPPTATVGIPTKADISGTVTILSDSAADMTKTYQALWDLFMADYPNAKVDMKQLAGGGQVGGWGQYIDGVATMIAGGQIPDSVWMATEAFRPFYSRGFFQPLDDLIARDKAEIQDYFDDVDPAVLEWSKNLTKGDNHTYYLPGPFNTVCMWCNVDVFKNAGLPEPKDDWTWDDLLAACKAITVPGETYAIHSHGAYFFGAAPWLLTNDAFYMNADWTQATINSPAAVEAADFAKMLVQEGYSPRPGGQFDSFTALAQGKLAMFAAGWWPIMNIGLLGIRDKIKMVPFPKNKRNGSPVGWTIWPIFKNSKNIEATWALIKFLSSKKANFEVFNQTGPAVPARRSAAKSEKMLSVGPRGTERLYEALSYATPIPGPDNSGIIVPQVEDTWNQILLGNVETKAGLDTLNKFIQDNL